MARFDLNLLHALDALLEEKNVTAAAERIGVSQPTMSGMLQRLREQLQDPLLVRVGKSFELTARARDLTDQVRQLLLSVSTLVEPQANFDLAKSSRHIRIMASEYSTLLVIPPILQLAASAAPSLSFEIMPIENPAERVYTGNVDLCITGDTIAEIEGGAATALRTQTLLVDYFVGLVDRGHPLRGEVTREEYFTYPRIVTHFPGIPRSVEDSIADEGPRLQPPHVRLPGFMAIGAMVVGSSSIGALPARLLPLIPAQWDVRPIQLPEDFSPVTIRALWHSRHDHDPIHQWLRGSLCDVCGQIARGDG